jgi:hypothetical protein
VPLLDTHNLEVRATSAREPPDIFGWDAFDPTAPKPATTVRHLKTGRGRVTFVTLLVPQRPGVPYGWKSHSQTGDETWRVELADGRFLSLRIPADPGRDLAGNVD